MEGIRLCFPQLPNASCRRPDPPQPETMLAYLLLYVVSALTAALNLLVIISISHFRQLHTPTNFLLLSLAVSDFFMGLLVMPVEILMTQVCWMLGDLMCAAYYLLPFVIISASVGNMVLISVDRYVAICDPLHYPTRITKKKIKICVCLCWTYSVFINVFILYDHMKIPGKYNSCLGECLVGIAGDVDLVLGFVIPIAIIIVLYLRIFVVAVSHARAMRPKVVTVTVTIGRSKNVRARRSEMKAARTLMVVVTVFLVCYCPYYAATLTGRTIMIGSSTEIYMVFVMYFNSCLNPVIYAFFYPWFRKCLRLIIALHILKPGSCETNIL
ncbi:trace amine-associated receptor 4-like [Mugil cephalus]|uniref:trace amine-associated receptor 4-like n=1 Tax=Mugil cephalus TaxID=48193 RepID=UPI001FB71863|nr:trace amine-associated receptor 4-like [Mugil cephalus]